MSANRCPCTARETPARPADDCQRCGGSGFVLPDGLAVAVPADGLEDVVADAIGDSIEQDWNSRDGARAVVEALRREGWAVVPPHEFNVPGPEPLARPAGDARIMVNGRPLDVPFRIVAEVTWQSVIRGRRIRWGAKS